MYRYDHYDHTIVNQRVAQFRDQTRRHLAGELTEDEFRPLRLQNGLYLQRHAPMLRIAIPYGLLSSRQLRMLARIARTYDRNVGHFSTRQNIQFNWVQLAEVPDILADLATVEMHAIQTSGNCVRNITSDQFAGVAPDEIVDPRPFCEILRQWSTLHPEFAYLPRKFKIAVNAARTDRAAIKVHDIGLDLRRNAAGAIVVRVLVGGGLGRTPMIGDVIRDDLPWPHFLTYCEAILRVYNRYGRRDNLYKARIKVLVKSLGIGEFARQVEAEWTHLKDGPGTLTQAELDRVAAHFAPPPYEVDRAQRARLRVNEIARSALGSDHTKSRAARSARLPLPQAGEGMRVRAPSPSGSRDGDEDPHPLPSPGGRGEVGENLYSDRRENEGGGTGEGADSKAFAAWVKRNVHGHKVPGYRAVTLSLKHPGVAPGDCTAEQMDSVAELADDFSFGELRVSHEQNLILADVRVRDLYDLWQRAKAAGLTTPTVGLLTNIVCCPGGDFCSLANAKSIPIAAAIQERFDDLDYLHDIGELDLNISGCMNACGHHHVGHIGILGVDKSGAEWYQITIGGNQGGDAAIGSVIGPSFAAHEVPGVIEKLIEVYLGRRTEDERFIDTVRRIGIDPFKARVYEPENPAEPERVATHG